jgi:hypothetical protein
MTGSEKQPPKITYADGFLVSTPSGSKYIGESLEEAKKAKQNYDSNNKYTASIYRGKIADSAVVPDVRNEARWLQDFNTKSFMYEEAIAI